MTTQITLTVQNGTTQHGNPRLLCSPPLWTDTLSFFLGNYVAHAATVVTYPGESIVSTVAAIIFALVFPASGVVRGLNAIIRHAAFTSDPIERAARAGALCMVVRTKDWKPLDGERIEDVIWRGRTEREAGKKYKVGSWWIGRPDNVTFANERVSDAKSLDFRFYWPPWMWELGPYWLFIDTLSGLVAQSKQVHGFYVLTPGYALAHVPRDALVVPSTSPRQVEKTCTISTNYSVAKALVAIIQLSFACITLGRSAGTEITDNGYGSYNLTVIQYALMSLFNLISITVNPTYPTLFLVSSEVMDEAVQRGSLFDGVVGKLVPERAEILGVENGKISGKFRVTNFVDDAHQTITWTDPSIETEKSESTYFFQPEFVSDTEIICQIGTMIRTSRGSVAMQVIAQQDMAARFKAKQPEYKLQLLSVTQSRSLGIADEPSLFVPCCPCFKRKWHTSYAVIYSRISRNPMGMIHFVGQNANRMAIYRGLLTQYGSLILASLTLAIIGGFTKFQKGESTTTSRVIFMTWLAVGIFMGSGVHNVMRMLPRTPFLWMGLPVWFLPAALGFYQVVVVQQRYGTISVLAAHLSLPSHTRLGENGEIEAVEAEVERRRI